MPGKKTVNSYQFKELKIGEQLEEVLKLLQYFHPNVSQENLIHAMEKDYRIFGLWIDNKLCSIATLIFYPHLHKHRRVWLQDGLVLPVKAYREATSKLLDCVLDFCFDNGISTVNLHVRVKNKRTQKFYQEKGGKYQANVYKWKI